MKFKPVEPSHSVEWLSEEGYFFRTVSDKRVLSPTTSCLDLIPAIFENEIYSFLSNSKSPLVIDCGANIGLGVLYWKLKYPEAKVIGFEPSKKVFSALEKNIKEFDLTDVTLINAAVTTASGTSEFTYNEGVSGSLFLEKDLGSCYRVNTVKLDEYLENCKIDFLKIDIEGEEINVFPQVLKHIHNIENLFIEYHSFLDRPQELSFILKGLESSGFRYYLEGEYKNRSPLVRDHTRLKQDLQVSIWAKKSG